eukprot:NODE_1788_length_1301_cov_6.815495_g1482_i0.p4 GENE.NODE_1788_length_1301_cov_6.815495_g1482_i0~~NODE_1788_length_1301_cov_6.815495_g1482_i0.p4  ORF type:complete len:51 (-),score=1.60 NODE_1788_length_1301_cov_6.815495_g1482_i0:810-962(-)
MAQKRVELMEPARAAGPPYPVASGQRPLASTGNQQADFQDRFCAKMAQNR